MAATAASLLALAILAVPQGPAAAAATGAGGKVDLTYTSYNPDEGGYALSDQPAKSLAPVSSSTATTLVVDPSITYQTYTGFGSSLDDTTVYHLTRLSTANREAALQAIFSEANGDNFNLMRTTIGCADFCRSAPDYWTYDDNGGTPDPALTNFSIDRDVTDGKIAIMQQILQINPKAGFFASMWSPPAWMKTTGSLIGTTRGTCPSDGTAPRVKTEYYPALANYYVKYVQAYRDKGIPIYALTLQNEPTIAMDYPSTCFTPAEQATFAKVLRSALDAADLRVKLWGLDDNEQNTFPYGDALLADAATNPSVDGLGFHNYGGTQMWEPTAVQAQYPTKTVHLTEITQGANKLVEYFRNQLSSYTGWAMMFQYMPGAGPGFWADKAPDPASDPDSDTPSLISPKASDPTAYDLNGWYYQQGQFSRYLQVGAQRIDSPGRIGTVSNVAFRNPDGTIVIIAVNRAETPHNSTVESTPDAPIRIVTPDGEFTDTLPGDTIATYRYTPTTGTALNRTGWSASASAAAAGYGAAQAIDGQSTTRWMSGTDQVPGQTYTLDLGAARTVDQMSLNEIELSGDFPAGYSLDTSTDATTWTAAATGAGTPAMTTIAFTPRSARYLRITLTAAASRWWSIGEVSVHAAGTGSLAVGTASASLNSGSAADAVDGAQGTRWSSQAAQAPGQYFQADLGLARTFDAVDLESGVSSGDFPRGYQVTVSADGVTWGNPVATGNGTEHHTLVATGSRTARYIRVTLTAGWSANWWSIAEFRVLNLSPVALSRSAASATSSSGTATAVLDGDAATRWTAGAAQQAGQWLQVDAGALVPLGGLALDAGTFTGGYPRGYRVQVSLDATTWKTVTEGSGTAQTTPILWPVTIGRYVRVTLTASSPDAWSVTEVNLYTVASTPAPGTSMSHSGWTATSSPAGVGSPADAIDGLLDTRWSSGTAQTGAEFFQVDLGAVRTFTGVQLNAAGPISNTGGDFPRGYEVYVSDGGAWTRVAAGTGYGPVVTATFPPQTARYVNVHQVGVAGDAWWSVAEFNVLT